MKYTELAMSWSLGKRLVTVHTSCGEERDKQCAPREVRCLEVWESLTGAWSYESLTSFQRGQCSLRTSSCKIWHFLKQLKALSVDDSEARVMPEATYHTRIDYVA